MHSGLVNPAATVNLLAERWMGHGTGPNSAGSAGQPEITLVTTLADSSWSLHNKYFTLHDAAGSVGVRLNGGALKEKTQVNFTGLTGADFINGGEGKWIGCGYAGAPSRDHLWFNTGTESEPSNVTGGGFIEVTIDGASTAAQIAAAALAALEARGDWQDAGTSGDVLVFENINTGATIDSSDWNTGAAVSTLVQGRAAAGAVGGATRSVIVPFAQNDTAAAIATAIETAFASDTGLSAVAASDQVTFTDLANGARIDAADGDTGFTLSTSQQGA